MTSKKVLKMAFLATLPNGDTQTRTLSLEDPKTDLDSSTVSTWMNLAIQKQAIMIGTVEADSIKEAYYEEVTKTPVVSPVTKTETKEL